MLTVEKNITLFGQSIINGVLVETYNASMNENNPEDMNISQSTANQELRKLNRTACREDRDKFEELAYSIQDKMISEKESTQDK